MEVEEVEVKVKVEVEEVEVVVILPTSAVPERKPGQREPDKKARAKWGEGPKVKKAKLWGATRYVCLY